MNGLFEFTVLLGFFICLGSILVFCTQRGYFVRKTKYVVFMSIYDDWYPLISVKEQVFPEGYIVTYLGKDRRERTWRVQKHKLIVRKRGEEHVDIRQLAAESKLREIGEIEQDDWPL